MAGNNIHGTADARCKLDLETIAMVFLSHLETITMVPEMQNWKLANQI